MCIPLCGQFRVEWFLRGGVARCPVKWRGKVRARQRRPARTDQTPESTPHIPLNANDFLNYWCGQLFPSCSLASCSLASCSLASCSLASCSRGQLFPGSTQTRVKNSARNFTRNCHRYHTAMPDPIPPFDHNLVLPPHLGSPTLASELSPYPCSTVDLCRRFGFSPERRAILAGFLDFRENLHAGGLLTGFILLKFFGFSNRNYY